MFLNQLSYQERKMFLNLSVHVAKADNVLEAKEKELISAYCNEMQLPAVELFEVVPMETITDYFAQADMHTKKIVLLEILGLAYVDGAYCEAEKNLIKGFVEKIEIPEEDYQKLNELISKYYLMCKDLFEAVQ